MTAAFFQAVRNIMISSAWLVMKKLVSTRLVVSYIHSFSVNHKVMEVAVSSDYRCE